MQNPTAAQIITAVAALMNDAPQDSYTNTAVLPYFNMALRDLEQEFELYDIAVTHTVSTTLAVNSGTSSIGFATSPALPADLIEIKQVWESPRSLNQWTPMARKDYIAHYLENNVTIPQFLIWAWNDQSIKLIAANANNDLKLDYVKYLFTSVTSGGVNNTVSIINCEPYLEFKTASYCSFYIGENETRAAALEAQAERNIGRVLNVNIKGSQSIKVRRKPFRASFKSRTWA